MAEIELRGLGQRYEGAAAHTLQNLCLHIPQGETHALLGGSGAGKTTLLNLLSGLLTPSQGQILFDGVDVTKLGAGERNVTQVFQFPVLYESLTVLGNLVFPLRNRGWTEADATRRAKEIAERLQLNSLLSHKPAKLSLFEKQMVAIGRSLVRPDIAMVLLDEPLTAVEPATKWRMRRALTDIQHDLRVTMVYVTHDQTEALTFADRISVMYDGRLLQTGTPQELFETPAHEHVAHFIGSPGMNLLPGTIRKKVMMVGDQSIGRSVHTDGTCVFGFRPEWARVSKSNQNELQAKVVGVRVLGAHGDEPFGIVSSVLGKNQIHTRQIISVKAGDSVSLHLDLNRVLTFREGELVSA